LSKHGKSPFLLVMILVEPDGRDKLLWESSCSSDRSDRLNGLHGRSQAGGLTKTTER
jgi:hypothetical protein